MSCRFKPVAVVLMCPASLPSRYFRPRGELTAGAPLRAPRHRLPSPRGRHGGQSSPATEPVPFDHPELRRRTTVLNNPTKPTG
jgi:hypothetical protein